MKDSDNLFFRFSDGSDKCETAWLTVKCYFEADPDVISFLFDNKKFIDEAFAFRTQCFRNR